MTRSPANTTAPFEPFTGTVKEFTRALHEHNLSCQTCAPSGLPSTDDGPLCPSGRTLRRSLAYARGREANMTGAYLDR